MSLGIQYILFTLVLVTRTGLTTHIVEGPLPLRSSPIILVAPSSYEMIIPRLQARPLVLYQNLYYEGNNIVMRDSEEGHSKRTAGYSNAEHWRKIVANTQATFVLRDALFSQQDHPYLFVPFALMLPANWITAAASENSTIQTVVAPSVHDENGWRSLTTARQMFGSFPPSEELFKLATKQLILKSDSAFVYHARETVGILAKYAQRLLDRRKAGSNAIIEEGAKLIAESDTLYFGRDVRQHHVIPIMVENPTQHEIQEGKGVSLITGDSTISETAAAVRRVVYQRRLADVDIAIERYDLSNAKERIRAIHVLEELIPRGSSGATVWLWVTGKLDPNRTLQGADASEYIGQFQQEIRASNINESRLRFVNKPSIQISRHSDSKQSFDKAAQRLRQLGLYLSVNLTSERLKYFFDSK